MIASHMVHAPTTTSSKIEIWSNSQSFNICVEHCTIKKNIAFLLQQAPDIWGTCEETCRRIEVSKHRSDDYFVYSDKCPILVIKTFALDMDTVACNEFNIVPSTWFLIYPRFTARSTDFASLRASSRINHATKFVQKEPVSIEYVTHSLVI
jgi:hypothetical protein